jgi:hypothetical protein
MRRRPGQNQLRTGTESAPFLSLIPFPIGGLARLAHVHPSGARMGPCVPAPRRYLRQRVRRHCCRTREGHDVSNGLIGRTDRPVRAGGREGLATQSSGARREWPWVLFSPEEAIPDDRHGPCTCIN